MRVIVEPMAMRGSERVVLQTTMTDVEIVEQPDGSLQVRTLDAKRIVVLTESSNTIVLEARP